MNEKPRLIETDEEHPGNVLLVSEFPWHVTERAIAAYLMTCSPLRPLTTRLYDNPANGSSRGICFVEYDTPTASPDSSPDDPPNTLEALLLSLKESIEAKPHQENDLQCRLYHLTNSRWDRGGRLPDIPTDPPPVPRGMQVGYGECGYVVRCGRPLGLPNTVLENNISKMRALRKRLRTNSRNSSSSSQEATD